jgi:acetylornithine deacetylase/succinyl-diaminopimelate desuccinylase-like protein
MYVLCQALGIPSVAGPGGGNPEANIHAPNENIILDDYVNAIKGVALLIQEFANN